MTQHLQLIVASSRPTGRARRVVALLGMGLLLLTACRSTVPPTRPPVVSPTIAPTLTLPLPTATAAPTAAAPAPTAISALPAAPAPSDTLAQRVDQILAKMTVEEKVGQLFLVFFTGPELSPALQQMIDQYHVGGVVLFGLSDNLRSLPQTAALINAIQHEAATQSTQVPLFVAIDQEGGPVVRLTQGATIFPSNMAVGATESITDARRMAEISADELKALGINMNLAPVMDVNNNPDNPVIGIRSFGSSPERVSELGVAMIEAYRAQGIIATAKHFPGHGDTTVDSHIGLPLIPHDAAHLQAIELMPFRRAIENGVDAIMTAHVLVPALEPTAGLPATLSANVLQHLLRERLGYDGLILTDSLGMGALNQNYTVAESGLMAFEAGVDMLAFGADPGHSPAEQKPVYAEILAAVKSGEIPESRLDQSVRRILLTKARYGLLDWQPVDVEAIPAHVGSPDHIEAARQIARDSVTLVKDDKGLLPIAADQAAVVIWPEGSGNLAEALRTYHPNLRALQVGLDPSPAEIDLAVRSADAGSLVIVGTLNARQHPGQIQLVQALADRSLIVVGLGAPYDLMSFPDVSTYLATYGDVPVSLEAAAQVMSGVIKPKGHLPVELAGVFPLGHGMTEFVSR